MKRTSAIPALLILLVLAGCSTADPRYVTIGGGGYRLTDPAMTAMLHVGHKSDGAFNPQFQPKLVTPIPVRLVTQAKIETESKSAYETAVKLGIPVAHVSAGGTSKESNLKTANLHVVNVIDFNQLATALRSEDNRVDLAMLMRYERPRIVTALVMVEDFSSIRTSGMTGKLGADYTTMGKVSWDGSIGGSSDSTRKETLSKGTIYAYQLARICWENVDGKVQVFSLVPDPEGGTNSCPFGTYDSAKQAENAVPKKSAVPG